MEQETIFKLNQNRTTNGRTRPKAIKLALVVHGRFHAFDLGRALIKQGVDVVLFTNYPKRIVKKFGIPPERVKPFLVHGILSWASAKLFGSKFCEPTLHKMFGRWAARQLEKQKFDASHSFTGISEEILERHFGGMINSIMRGSVHIEVQARLLEEEERRAGVRIDKPSQWMIQREKREYAAARFIIVLSSFARDSFLEQGVPARKLFLLPLGSELTRFRPPAEVIEERCARILSGKPLRVLTVGTFSFQKGILDLVSMAEALHGKMAFSFVGSIAKEARALHRQVDGLITFLPKMKQHDLPTVYKGADLFVFPTIQDGYAVVLSQAQASGLPILATTNCAAPDLLQEAKTGWVLPIRSPSSFVDRLHWCDQHRAELAGMVRYTYHDFKPRDWNQVALDLVRMYEEWFESHPN
jgi:glycosyltransferase involved in cell wall biosynthesis